MRCTTIVDGRRCQEEEGHDTGVGTPHLLFADTGAVTSAEVAARELSQRLGIPCTAIGVDHACWAENARRDLQDSMDNPRPPRVIDDGDTTCAQTDGTPEGAAAQLEAMWGALDATGPMAALTREMSSRRRRVLAAIRNYLAASERDWQAMFVAAPAEAAVTAIQDAKQLHDAQLAELFERIGAAL